MSSRQLEVDEKTVFWFTYEDNGGCSGDPVDSAQQSGGSNSRHDTRINPFPRTSRIRRSVDGLPHVAETNANRSSVQTAGHSDHATTAHTVQF